MNYKGSESKGLRIRPLVIVDGVCVKNTSYEDEHVLNLLFFLELSILSRTMCVSEN